MKSVFPCLRSDCQRVPWRGEQSIYRLDHSGVACGTGPFQEMVAKGDFRLSFWEVGENLLRGLQNLSFRDGKRVEFDHINHRFELLKQESLHEP